MTLLDVFKAIEAWPAAVVLRKSTYAFPAIEVVHVLGLTLLLGSILVMDMRLLGVGMRRQTISSVARSVTPLYRTALGLTLATGLVLFLAESVKCFFNEAFWWKMGLLAAAVAFHATLFRWVVARDGAGAVPARATAILSLSLWFGVGLAGRVIGFI